MADKDYMPKLNVEKDLTPEQRSQIYYMNKVHRENVERVMKLKRLRKRNLSTGLLLGGAVLGIYAYSMIAVKQEKFLDELDIPTEKELQT
ncbi:cytochrome c oxidase assembly factor 3, mitochondrial-like [Centruroides sculpturatus]|uniref:cytochrome c oxidase assembly factor 3, mitochondrial-like n=1 Tax=Centruroides sculpturatus TaxID=218467 RepID=UPI000C6EDEA1|nr:cytochrome c oxidase assembly factor 3, mitochondrial-like [Centruroides sculpturatus]